jgi:RNA polymerase sigma-70 factor (ECF subfamily)
MDALADCELVSRVQASYAQAFGTIYCRHRPYVRSCLQRLTKKSELTEDLVQETFIRALERIDLFDPNSERANVRAWLRTIALNVCANKLNRLGLERRSTLAALETRSIGSASACDPSIAASRSETQGLLIKAISQLPELMAKCIVSHYVFGLSYAEICDVYGMRMGRVIYLLHRGRHILAKRLRKYL